MDSAPSAGNQRPWQFALSSLLWLMLVVAAGLSGYRWGYHAATAEMRNYRQHVGIPYARSYNVVDLVDATPPDKAQQRYAAKLIDDICRDVLPRTWAKSGGTATIVGYAQKRMIIVNHDSEGQDQVAAYLENRRQSRP